MTSAREYAASQPRARYERCGLPALHFRWLSEGKVHHGIFFCADRHIAAIGEIVNTCYAYYRLIEEGAGTLEDIQNEFFEIR
jgi:hypothetical protein